MSVQASQFQMFKIGLRESSFVQLESRDHFPLLGDHNHDAFRVTGATETPPPGWDLWLLATFHDAYGGSKSTWSPVIA